MDKHEPVAWRVKDFADGWIIYQNEGVAKAAAKGMGARLEPLYPSPQPTEAEAITAWNRREDKVPAWPPLKKAIWDVVTFEQLNDGHYINAYDLTDKLHFAVTAAESELARLKAQPGVVKVLEDAAKAFEEIRLILVKHLDEPERSAFWKAVRARDAVRAALTAPVSQEPVAWAKEGKPMGELVLIPRDLAERVTEIANRNEQSAEGDRLAALLSSPTPSLLEDAARVEQTDEQFHKTLKDAYEKSDMDAAARALSGRLRQMEKRAKAANARADRLAAEIELAKPVYSRRELERKVVVAKEVLAKIASPTQTTDLLWWQHLARNALASLKDQNNDE